MCPSTAKNYLKRKKEANLNFKGNRPDSSPSDTRNIPFPPDQSICHFTLLSIFKVVFVSHRYTDQQSVKQVTHALDNQGGVSKMFSDWLQNWAGSCGTSF